ncbi:GNAT family N-acetyltransferase [Streptomyces chattanoogensis]|uniref:Acetyltransferase n=1 Tax=Streptomyces chattanoogensis TaxID=66876 RepID=A0A0N0GVF5_9ACTN|nr:GNAT family N-acetyltransferase [Streptomyces chattanoogensis]KPC59239.1 acetyltransferase [Streptomyces chattanoogensis]
MTERTAPEFTQIIHPWEINPEQRRELIECWTVVSNAGGAVVPLGFPPPPVGTEEVAPAVDELIAGLDPQRGRLLLATIEGDLAGWLVVRRDPHPFIAHWGELNHLQTHPRFRGRGIGTALMHRVQDLAREEMGLEQLHLAARAGMGLEEFYRRLGWREIGRWPGALRLAPGDDRDDILMVLTV